MNVVPLTLARTLAEGSWSAIPALVVAGAGDTVGSLGAPRMLVCVVLLLVWPQRAGSLALALVLGGACAYAACAANLHVLPAPSGVAWLFGTLAIWLGAWALGTMLIDAGPWERCGARFAVMLLASATSGVLLGLAALESGRSVVPLLALGASSAGQRAFGALGCAAYGLGEGVLLLLCGYACQFLFARAHRLWASERRTVAGGLLLALGVWFAVLA
ncbi:MAG: hypothetical protein ACYDA5_03040 [Vulcanimicrobiaceae bacterium]